MVAGNAQSGRFPRLPGGRDLHQGSAGVAGEFKRMIEYTDYYQKCHDIMANFILEKTKIKKKKIDEIFHGKTDFYITSSEAISLGVIDEMI